jgi:hypothetical protein
VGQGAAAKKGNASADAKAAAVAQAQSQVAATNSQLVVATSALVQAIKRASGSASGSLVNTSA